MSKAEEQITLNYANTAHSKNKKHREYPYKLVISFKEMPERFLDIFKEPVNNVDQDSHYIIEDKEDKKKFFKDIKSIFKLEDHINLRFKTLSDLEEFYHRIKAVNPPLNLNDITMSVIAGVPENEIVKLESGKIPATVLLQKNLSKKSVYIEVNKDSGGHTL